MYNVCQMHLRNFSADEVHNAVNIVRILCTYAGLNTVLIRGASWKDVSYRPAINPLNAQDTLVGIDHSDTWDVDSSSADIH